MIAACVRTFGKSMSGFERKGTDKSIASCVASTAAGDIEMRQKATHVARNVILKGPLNKDTGYKHKQHSKKLANNKAIEHALVVASWRKVSISRLKGVHLYTTAMR